MYDTINEYTETITQITLQRKDFVGHVYIKNINCWGTDATAIDFNTPALCADIIYSDCNIIIDEHEGISVHLTNKHGETMVLERQGGLQINELVVASKIVWYSKTVYLDNAYKEIEKLHLKD